MLLLADKLDAIVAAMKNCKLFSNRNIKVFHHSRYELEIGEEFKYGIYIVLAEFLVDISDDDKIISETLRVEIGFEAADTDKLAEVDAAMKNIAYMKVTFDEVENGRYWYNRRCPVHQTSWCGNIIKWDWSCDVCGYQEK